jgi:cytochrome d ubiquinol oxidase subunit I
MEILDTTQDNAPFRFGGKLDKETGVSNGGLTFDGGLSWLAKGSTDAEVKGLDSVDKQFWPPLVVHTLFDIKLALIPLLLIVPLVFLGLYKKAKAKAFSKPMLIAMMVTGLAGIVVTELGWMLTEIGRQPWAVTGHVLTKDAFTTSPGVQALGFLFPTVFVILFVLTYIALRKTISSFNARKDSK